MKPLVKSIFLTFVLIFCLVVIGNIPLNPAGDFKSNWSNNSPSGIVLKAKMPPASQTVVGKVWTGDDGIVETVAEIMKREQNNPFHFNGVPHEPKEEEEFEHPMKSPNPEAPESPQWPIDNENRINLNGTQNYNPQTVGVSFLGPQVSESGFIPPDNNGAAGPTQIIVIANGRIKVFDKTGVLGALNTTTDNFFTSVRNGSGTSDPHVRYDRLTQRWFITMINVSTPDRILIAMSSGPTITGTSSFTFFQFEHDLVGTVPNSDTGDFADYDTFGLDRYALYIGVNIFNASGTSFLGTTGFVVNKANLISGTLSVTPFRQLCAGAGAGPYTPQGVDNDDPGATEGYFIGVDNAVFSQLDIRRISNPGGVPSISGNITLIVPTTYIPITQVASGSNRPLDALDDRLFAAHVHKNKITGTQSLWTAHNVRVNSSGVAGSTGDRNASRWYEITNLTTTPVLNQSGTLFDNAGSNPKGFWIPSVAMNGQGHMALGCSMAASNVFAEIVVAGRLSGDVLGTLQTFTLAQSSSTAYNIQNNTTQRWGDYSQVNIDPNDDMTMWTIQEYCNATNSWAEQVIQLKSLPPATITGATSVTSGSSSVNSTITGVSSSGSGFFDPGPDAGGPGFANHISASVSGGVIVNSVTFNTATQVTLNLNTVGIPSGLKDVTITNPDGQSMTTVGILNITPPLPVQISSFSFTTESRDVTLNWTTVLEINNSGFDVERENSESHNWESIGFVRGKGTTFVPNNYHFTDEKLNTGTYLYRLKQIDFNGNFQIFNLSNDVSIGKPGSFDISQNYPNPSNPMSKIDYQLLGDGKVSISVFDITGRVVSHLVDKFETAGFYSTVFDGTSLASGIYFYRINVESASGKFTKTLRLILVK